MGGSNRTPEVLDEVRRGRSQSRSRAVEGGLEGPCLGAEACPTRRAGKSMNDEGRGGRADDGV